MSKVEIEQNENDVSIRLMNTYHNKKAFPISFSDIKAYEKFYHENFEKIPLKRLKNNFPRLAK